MALLDPRKDSIYGPVREHAGRRMEDEGRFTVAILPHHFTAAERLESRPRYQCAWCPLPEDHEAHGYQGWSNRATWCAALWLGNDEPLYREAQRLYGIASADERPDALRDAWMTTAPAMAGHELRNAGGASMVDWAEIADGWAD